MSDAARARHELRIGMIAPPWFEVPPDGYGGIETTVAYLVDELVVQGHEVTLLGVGAHGTKAQRFVPVFDEPPTQQMSSAFIETWYAARVDAALRRLDLDVVHDHSLAGPLTARGRRCPTVYTAHNPVHARFGDYLRSLGGSITLVALSLAQINAAPDLPWAGCVPNGVAISDYPFQATKSDYLLFLGRIAPEKGAHLAIDGATAAGRRIIVAGRCEESTERRYFVNEIEPRLRPGVEWYGSANATQKAHLLARAAAVLCPFQWEEPFCLVIVEAMACGTPVIATARGAAPELVVDAVTGYLVADQDHMVRAIADLDRVNPQACRSRAERAFSADRMARAYISVYRRLAQAPAAPQLAYREAS